MVLTFRFLGKKIVAFSHLCGEKISWSSIHELKHMGFITLLGGPQSRQDYDGEPDTDSHPHRFQRAEIDP